MVFSYDDRKLGQWKKGTWTKTIRNAARRGAAESLMEEWLQTGANKWMDTEGGVEQMGDYAGAGSASQNTDHIYMDCGLPH